MGSLLYSSKPRKEGDSEREVMFSFSSPSFQDLSEVLGGTLQECQDSGLLWSVHSGKFSQVSFNESTHQRARKKHGSTCAELMKKGLFCCLNLQGSGQVG